MRISIACVVAVLACLPARSAFAASCDGLATLALKDTAITKAEVGAAGAFEAPGGGAGRGPNPYAALGEFCRVAATLTPTSDSDIKIEVWLPASGWNGKFQAVGNGGATVNTRARPVTGGGVPGVTNVPAAINSAAVTVVCGSARPTSDSHDAASSRAGQTKPIATPSRTITSRMALARILPEALPHPRDTAVTEMLRLADNLDGDCTSSLSRE